jgi:hypothetical protein
MAYPGSHPARPDGGFVITEQVGEVPSVLNEFFGVHASATVTAALAAVAEAVRAPSTVLAASRAATRATGLRVDGLGIINLDAEKPPAAVEPAEPPGHFERILSELGETDQTALR